MMSPAPWAYVCLLAGAVCAWPGGLLAAPGAEDLLIVDCSLPGQIRQLGRATTYVAPRQPERTTALDCRIRGGEYVVRDRASLKSSLAVWLEQARSGDPEAQTIVGELFERGVGATPDPGAAAAWYQRAAEAGYARAQVNLGHLYENGLGVAKDARRALSLYRQAAGMPDAIELETVPDVAPLLAARDQTIAELEEQVRTLQQDSARLRKQLSRPQAAPLEDPQAEGLAAELEQTLARLREREAQLSQLSADTAARLEEQREARSAAVTAGGPSAAGDLQDRVLAGPDIVLIEPQLGMTRGLVKVSAAAPASPAAGGRTRDGASWTADGCRERPAGAGECARGFHDRCGAARRRNRSDGDRHRPAGQTGRAHVCLDPQRR